MCEKNTCQDVIKTILGELLPIFQYFLTKFNSSSNLAWNTLAFIGNAWKQENSAHESWYDVFFFLNS